jgi:hypothetical protein
MSRSHKISSGDGHIVRPHIGRGHTCPLPFESHFGLSRFPRTLREVGLFPSSITNQLGPTQGRI